MVQPAPFTLSTTSLLGTSAIKDLALLQVRTAMLVLLRQVESLLAIPLGRTKKRALRLPTTRQSIIMGP